VKSVCIIQHVPFETPGVLLDVFQEMRFPLKMVEAPFLGELSEMDMRPDILVVMGGPIGAYEESSYPFLKEEMKWIERHLAGGGIFLGICLGSQILARVMGARVYPGKGKEIGWFPLSLNDAGKSSPLVKLEGRPVLHWHGDTFDLPECATLLASTSSYPHQAFSAGKRVLGLQFHLEVTPRDLERWYVGHACEISGESRLDVSAMRRQGKKHSGELLPVAKTIFRDWLENALLPE
jgi:GMP synthase (glutamine-hydrolysing)